MDFSDVDGKRTLNVIIDRTLAEQLGYRTPAAAVGAIIYRQPYLPRLTLRIIGVVENATDHLTDAVGSRADLYIFAPKMAGFAIVRFHPQSVDAAVAQLQKTWKALAPGVPLERRFVDQLFEDSYSTFAGISSVAIGLTICAVLIALMGLSGMAVQVTNGRLREIGVRKTLGAKPHRILALLMLDFAKPVVVANLIAWPFAYLAARAYLSLFFTPVPLSPFVFLASLVASVGVACLVVCGQSLRASRAQPADVLRYE
jgi:putative ABC transport system permease protein